MVALSGTNSSGVWPGLLLVASHLCLFSFHDIDTVVICNCIDRNQHYFQKDCRKKKNRRSLYLHHAQSFWKWFRIPQITVKQQSEAVVHYHINTKDIPALLPLWIFSQIIFTSSFCISIPIKWAARRRDQWRQGTFSRMRHLKVGFKTTAVKYEVWDRYIICVLNCCALLLYFKNQMSAEMFILARRDRLFFKIQFVCYQCAGFRWWRTKSFIPFTLVENTTY